MNAATLATLAAVVLRTAIVFVVMVAGIRLTGKRQMGEMNLPDLLLVLVMANAVQNAMTRGDGRLSVALASAGTLIVFGYLFEALMCRHHAWRTWLVGTPTVVAQDGRLVRGAMRREGVTEGELMAAVHDQGVADLAGVRLAVLEVDGSVSVIPREDQRKG